MRLLIVDDHVLFREGLRLILMRLSDRTEVMEAGSVPDALAAAGSVDDLDLILLDLQLPGTHGFDGLTVFRKNFPACPVVLLSGFYDPLTVREGMARGAQGFLPKAMTADDMLRALRKVLGGENWTPGDAATLETQTRHASPINDRLTLTGRQREVLVQLSQGYSNKEIGRILNMSDNTVRSHVAAIFRALGSKSRTEAASMARRYGLL